MARQKAPKRKYFCDCPRYCKTLREVSKSTYNEHARHMQRDADPQQSSLAPQASGSRLANAVQTNGREDELNEVRPRPQPAHNWGVGAEDDTALV